MWPGNPDETTDFSNAEFEIDYVRVYKKPQYDTNVQKPVKIFREPIEDGNLIYNGTRYRITFDACAASERDMIVCVSAPTNGWIRYFADTSLTLSTD